ncbi:hypothetical protein ACJX0J_018699, partial [Zea mays]
RPLAKYDGGYFVFTSIGILLLGVMTRKTNVESLTAFQDRQLYILILTLVDIHHPSTMHAMYIWKCIYPHVSQRYLFVMALTQHLCSKLCDLFFIFIKLKFRHLNFTKFYIDTL